MTDESDPTHPDPPQLATTLPDSDPGRRPARTQLSAAKQLGETQPESDPATALVRRDDCIELPPGSIVDDIYEIDAKLGAGAMGEVYAARHVKLGKRVAIKVIRPRLSADVLAIERFAMEARALAQIQHPAIVTVDHVGELADGRAYFVMEYLRGESLFDRLSRGCVQLPEALRILDQMIRGLEAAHARGVIHRDLKPENTYLVYLPGEATIVKLLDFGLAKLAATAADVAPIRDDQRTERTQSGVTIGTPLYMSPEQTRGPDVDHRTDVYALGCIAYELLLGRHPFSHARTAPAVFAAHLHEPPPLPRSIWPEIPPQLDLALFAMLAKDPEHRPTLEQLRSVVADTRTSSASRRAATELVAPPRVHGAKSRALAITLMTALIGGLAFGAVLTRTRGKTHAAATTQILDGGSADVVTQALTADANLAADSMQVAPSSTGSGSGMPIHSPRTSRPSAPSPRIESAPDAPSDAGIDDATITADAPPATSDRVEPRTRPVDRNPPPAPMDRNQTINPFAPKHHKVNQ